MIAVSKAEITISNLVLSAKLSTANSINYSNACCLNSKLTSAEIAIIRFRDFRFFNSLVSIVLG